VKHAYRLHSSAVSACQLFIGLCLVSTIPLPFCRRWTGQPISVLVTSSLCIRKDVSSISVLTCNGNGSYGTKERQRFNGTAKPQRQNGNGMVETRH